MNRIVKVRNFEMGGRYLFHRNAVNRVRFKSDQFPVLRDDMLKPDSFKNKTALVTGGGTGLGYGMSMKISSLGAKVAIASRKVETLNKAANEIEKKTGNKASKLKQSRNCVNVELHIGNSHRAECTRSRLS